MSKLVYFWHFFNLFSLIFSPYFPKKKWSNKLKLSPNKHPADINIMLNNRDFQTSFQEVTSLDTIFFSHCGEYSSQIYSLNMTSQPKLIRNNLDQEFKLARFLKPYWFWRFSLILERLYKEPLILSFIDPLMHRISFFTLFLGFLMPPPKIGVPNYKLLFISWCRIWSPKFCSSLIKTQ